MKIKYETINLTEIKQENPKNHIKNKNKEINFFGLLLKVSKDFFTPTYNLIIHINGGGCFSQSSESHLSYLKKYIYMTIILKLIIKFKNKDLRKYFYSNLIRWAINSETVIVSIDYLLTSENKFPKIFDEIYQAYEMILKFSNKIFSILFSLFNINLKIIY